MKIFKTRSLDKNVSDEQLENQGVYITSFLSFERAIEESLYFSQQKGRSETMEDVEGYRVTKQGIEIIWK